MTFDSLMRKSSDGIGALSFFVVSFPFVFLAALLLVFGNGRSKQNGFLVLSVLVLIISLCAKLIITEVLSR